MGSRVMLKWFDVTLWTPMMILNSSSRACIIPHCSFPEYSSFCESQRNSLVWEMSLFNALRVLCRCLLTGIGEINGLLIVTARENAGFFSSGERLIDDIGDE